MPRWQWRGGRPRGVIRPMMFVVTVLVAVFGLRLATEAGWLLAGSGAAEASECRIVSVIDGDTVRTWCSGRGLERARLSGFDTPEAFSPKCLREAWQARAAGRHLRQILRCAETVSMVRQGTDRYGRALVAVYVDGRPLHRMMIDAGHARPYAGGRRAGWCA